MAHLRQLPLIREHSDKYRALEAAIAALFRDEIYRPLMAELERVPGELANAQDVLMKAIQDGQIQYARGRFEGKFSSKLSKEIKALGGKFDGGSGTWRLSSEKLTPDIRASIGVSKSRFEKMGERILSKLDEISTRLPFWERAGQQAQTLFDQTIYKVNKEFDDSVKGVTVAPKFTDADRERIRDEYARTTQLEIVDWSREETLNLRRQVSAAVSEGIRREAMVGAIQHSYGVSLNKAKFIARQETALLTSKLKQVRYEAAGIEKYRWKCVAGTPAHPVRPMHLKLNDTIQRWDDPPIVNEKRECKHPGCDWNCRCNAIAVVRF